MLSYCQTHKNDTLLTKKSYTGKVFFHVSKFTVQLQHLGSSLDGWPALRNPYMTILFAQTTLQLGINSLT